MDTLPGFSKQEVKERLKQISYERESRKELMEAHKIYLKAKRDSQKNNTL